MDRLRSCYRSKWRFPGIGEVEGQYYFVDPSNESFPDHYLFSRNWLKGGHLAEPAFGESFSAVETWTNGTGPFMGCFPATRNDLPDYPGSPQNWEFSLAGVTPGTCLDCLLLNTRVVLPPVPGIPRWQTALFPWCTGANIRWLLTLGGVPGLAVLQFSGFGGGLPTLKVQYERLLTEWNNFGVNCMTLNPATVSAHCINWPQSVGLIPSSG